MRYLKLRAGVESWQPNPYMLRTGSLRLVCHSQVIGLTAACGWEHTPGRLRWVGWCCIRVLIGFMVERVG